MSNFYGIKTLKSDLAFTKFLEQEVGDYLHKVSNSPKLYSNDLRHQYAAAVFTQMRGAKITKILGELNEIGNFSGRDDKEIDLYNNSIGIQYGLEYPLLDRATLLKMLYADFAKNRDKRIKDIGK